MAVKQFDRRTILQVLVAKSLVIHGYTKKELAIKLSMSPASLYNKLNNPDSFTVKEIRKLSEVFKLSKEEHLNITYYKSS